MPIDHLSASSLQMLEVCPRQWQQRYLKGRIEAPGAARVLGQANHRAHGFNWNVKIMSGADVPTSSIVEFFHDQAWPDTLAEYGGSGEIKWDDTPDAARLLGEKMVTVYHEQVSPRLLPDRIEKEFTLDMPGVPVPVVGYIDLTQKQNLPIVDLKTSKNRVSKIKGQWRLQGMIYQLAEKRPVDWHVVTKAKQPAAVTPLEEPGLMQPLNWLQLGAMVKLVHGLAWTANYYYETYGPDEDWPTLGVGHDWRCDWCGYKNDCPAWRVE